MQTNKPHPGQAHLGPLYMEIFHSKTKENAVKKKSSSIVKQENVMQTQNYKKYT